jgi:protease IV
MKDFIKYVFATITGLVIATVLMGILSIIVVVGMVTAMGSQKEKSQKDTLLELSLAMEIPEQSEENPIMELLDQNFASGLGLDKILHNLKRAAIDPNIKGILIKPGYITAGYTTLDEIRKGIAEFRAQGKFVYAYCEFLNEKSYFIASACDSIYLNPTGEMMLDGLSSNMLFMSGFFKKIGVNMELFKVGAYKGAAESWTLDKPSEANTEQIQRLLDVVFDYFCNESCKSRGMDAADFKQKVNEYAIQSPNEALAAGWIDRLAYEDEVAAVIKNNLGKDPEDKICFTMFGKYFKMEGPELNKTKSKDRVAIVYISGEITNGDEGFYESGCKTIMKSLRKVRYNEDVKAVVIRVNSPGGSAFGSEQLWREIDLISKVKPVVVSMGDMAASGGYYVATPARAIFASPVTLTGSIGVFALFPNMKELFNEKLGLEYHSIKTGIHSNIGLPDKEFTEEQRALIQKNVNRVYRLFTQRVEDGRGIDSSYAESLAQGRVWVGSDALSNKLVDQMGYLEEAVQYAANEAKLKENEYKIIRYPKAQDPLQAFFSFTKVQKERNLKADLGFLYPFYEAMKLIKHNTGVQARMPFIPVFD